MSELSKLKPQSRQRIMDLVQEAGIDVDDWSIFKQGRNEARAASNPKYCYEWSFEKEHELVVLNIWFRHVTEAGGRIFHVFNMRELSHQFARSGDGVRAKRALQVDIAEQHAWFQGLPVRVVLCEGDISDPDIEEGRASRVHMRQLDDVSWAITSYDMESGECVITRGAIPISRRYADQFSQYEGSLEDAQRRAVSGSVFERDPRVRAKVLARAAGSCELCGVPGFPMSDGRVYLETHHVIPLAQGGKDHVLNVAALCANHHREAHFGERQAAIKEALLAMLGAHAVSP